MNDFLEYVRLLRAGRALAGLSQDELAQMAGISRQMVVRLEGGRGNVSISAIEAARRTLEELGIVFLDTGEGHGPGVALARAAPQRGRGGDR